MLASGSTITGAASTIVKDNLPSHVVLVSNEDGKVASSSLSLNNLQGVIIGGATTITDNNLTPNKVVISDGSGKVSTSQVSNIEVGYLVGTTGLIQNHLSSKANQSTTCTKTEVDTQLTNLIDSAPDVLNTLNELADALNDDANYVCYNNTKSIRNKAK